MKKPIIIIGVIVLVMAGAVVGYALTHKTKAPGPAPIATEEISKPVTTSTTAETTTQTAVITYSDNGFNPAQITVKSGTTVTIKNTTSHTVQFDSDPHPAHTDNKDLNAGIVAAGKTDTFVAVNKGSFGYHNHLDDNETGTIIVE